YVRGTPSRYVRGTPDRYVTRSKTLEGNPIEGKGIVGFAFGERRHGNEGIDLFGEEGSGSFDFADALAFLGDRFCFADPPLPPPPPSPPPSNGPCGGARAPHSSSTRSSPPTPPRAARFRRRWAATPSATRSCVASSPRRRPRASTPSR